MYYLSRIFAIAALLVVLALPVTHAAVEHFSGSAEYLMNNHESIKVAQETVLKEALRRISQQAAVVIRSHSSAADNQLTADEVEMVTSIVLQVTDKKFQKSVDAQGKITVKATAEAELDVDKAERMSQEIMAAKSAQRNIAQIRDEYSTTQSQYRQTEKKYSMSVQQYAKYKVRQGIELERQGKTAEAPCSFTKKPSSIIRITPVHTVGEVISTGNKGKTIWRGVIATRPTP